MRVERRLFLVYNIFMLLRDARPRRPTPQAERGGATRSDARRTEPPARLKRENREGE